MEVLYSSVPWFFNHADPWYFISISASLFVLFLIGFSPCFSSSMVNEEYTVKLHAGIKLRQIAWMNLVFIGLFLPLSVFIFGLISVPNKDAYASAFGSQYFSLVSDLWIVPAFSATLAFLLNLVFNRYLKPRWSALKRRWSVRQSGDELSDIRAEKENLKTKNFTPEKHFSEDRFFWGLTKNDIPIFDSWEVWKTRHFRLVGPTQTGKGVLIGTCLDQAIRKGSTVFFIDPKPDKHAKAIMKKACLETGRPFVELDLRGGHKGRYEPFLGGEDRQARARLTFALGLRDTGTDGDFYKSNERRIIDKIFSEWDRRLYSLKQILAKDEYFKDVTRSLNYINEWLGISTFRVNKDKRGFAVDKSFENNAVVYIRGDLDDEVINKACTVLIMEICQECKRLYEKGIKKDHALLLMDEVAFLINEQIADALATVAGFDMNIGLAYQSEGDLLNLKDKTLNADAIASRVKVNCKNSLYYMAADSETAEIMAEESGLIYKSVTRSQGVMIGEMMEETWDKKRDIHQVDENLVTANQAKMLPERVGVLYRPNTLAEICHTAWINVEIEEATPTLEQVEVIAEPAKPIVEDLPDLPIENDTEEAKAPDVTQEAKEDQKKQDKSEAVEPKKDGAKTILFEL